jgi:hypothetical protein
MSLICTVLGCLCVLDVSFCWLLAGNILTFVVFSRALSTPFTGSVSVFMSCAFTSNWLSILLHLQVCCRSLDGPSPDCVGYLTARRLELIESAVLKSSSAASSSQCLPSTLPMAALRPTSRLLAKSSSKWSRLDNAHGMMMTKRIS